MSDKGLFPYPLDQILYGLLAVGNLIAIFLHPEMATVAILGATYFSYLAIKPVLLKRRNHITDATPKKNPDEKTKI